MYGFEAVIVLLAFCSINRAAKYVSCFAFGLSAVVGLPINMSSILNWTSGDRNDLESR